MAPRRTAWTTSALVAGFMASPALAQPNPFDDHEAGEMAPEALPEEPADLPPEGGQPEASPTPSPETPSEASKGTYAYQQWRWSVGAGTQFAYTGTTSELLVGNDVTNRTLFLTLAPRVGLFVVDRVEVALSLGHLSKLTAREKSTSSAENNFFFEVAGHYHIPIADSGFAFIPGLGVGGYFGTSSRDLTLSNGNTLDENTKTRGFLVNGYIGVAYHPSTSWRIKSGIALGALFGSEKVSSLDVTLGTSAAHVGLPLEVAFVF